MSEVIKLSGEMKEINLEDTKEDLEYYLFQIKQAIDSNTRTLTFLENLQEESTIDEEISEERKTEIYEASEIAIGYIYEFEEVLYKIKNMLK